MGEKVFEATTRGGRYAIQVERRADGSYRCATLTRGVESGSGVGLDATGAAAWCRQSIETARRYDGINYRITLDKINVAG